ncbi:hypothetical protein OC845_000963 [Tilletia horrida]|nr:hypothetical protein OC845_000963 [Tilletia horrida]
MASQPDSHPAAEPSSFPASVVSEPVPTGSGRPRSLLSSASSSSIGSRQDVEGSSVPGHAILSSSPPVTGRPVSTASSSHHHHHHFSSHSHALHGTGHGPHSAHIVRAKAAVRSSNPGWRASVCGPSSTAAPGAAGPGLDSPTLARDSQAAGYVYGYAGMHHAPGSPSLSTRTSISSASGGAGGPAQAANNISAQNGRGAGGSSQGAARAAVGSGRSDPSAAGGSSQGHQGHTVELNEQYSNLSGASRQSIAMAAFKWDSLPVMGSTSANGSDMGVAAESTVSSSERARHLASTGLPHDLDDGDDLISEPRSFTQRTVEPAGTEIMNEIPVLSPPYGEFGQAEDADAVLPAEISPRGGSTGAFPSFPPDGDSRRASARTTGTMHNLLQRRFEHEMRARNMSESRSPGARFGESSEHGYGGSASAANLGSRQDAQRQSHSGFVAGGEPSSSEISASTSNANSENSSPQAPRTIQTSTGDGRRESASPGSRTGTSSVHDGPAYRPPPPLRLVPIPAAPKIAGAGHEGKYDWANFVFAYSRGKWDPQRLPRPPGHSTLHPGVKTRITQPSALARKSSFNSGEVSAAKRNSIVPSSAGLVASPKQVSRVLTQPSVLESDGLTAPGLQVSPATPLEGPKTGDEQDQLADLAPRRPSLTYIADSPPSLSDSTGLPLANTKIPVSPFKPVTAEEAAARVAVASLTAQALLRERDDAKLAAASGSTSGAAACEDEDQPGPSSNELVVGMDTQSLSCTESYTSPFTNVAVQNMLDERAKASGSSATASGGEKVGTEPAMLSPTSLVPGGKDAVPHGREGLALSAALGTHVASQRSHTYNGTDHIPDPLSYNKDANAQSKTDADRDALEQKSGGRDRQAGPQDRLDAAAQTKSLPAGSDPNDLWDSSSIGLSKRKETGPQDQSKASSDVRETEKTPAHPGGFKLDAKSQRKVEAIAEQDFKEQLARSSANSTAQLSNKAVLTDRSPFSTDDAKAGGAAVLQRPGPTPVQTSPPQSTEGKVKPVQKKAGSARSSGSGSGSSGAGSFHNPALHRRRRPSPSTGNLTPPASGGPGAIPRRIALPPGIASSSSSPTSSDRTLGLGAVTPWSRSSRGDTSAVDDQGDADGARAKGPSIRSNSSPSAQRFDHSRLDVQAEAANEIDEPGGPRSQEGHAAPQKRSTASPGQKQVGQVQPGSAEDKGPTFSTVGSSNADKPTTTGNMGRHASYNGTPAPRSPDEAYESTSASGNGSSISRRKKRPGSSGGVHHSIKNSPHVHVSRDHGSGWGGTGLNSSAVAELRLAASRRKSLETDVPMLLNVGPSTQRDGTDQESAKNDERSTSSSTKVNRDSAKQSGAALRLSGKLPYSTGTGTGSKGSSATANLPASALGMLKLQLTHSLSFPPDKELQDILVQKLIPESSEFVGKEVPTPTSAAEDTRKSSHSESLLTYTLKQSKTEIRDGVQVTDRWTAKQTVQHIRSEQAETAEKDAGGLKVDAQTEVRSRDFASTRDNAPSDATKNQSITSTPPQTRASQPMKDISTPVRSATAIPSSAEKVKTSPVAASVHESSLDAKVSDIPDTDTNACALSSFHRAGDGVGQFSRANLLPSGAASTNMFLAAGGRAEAFYIQNGYLPAILPPNEIERRQALKRYGPPKLAGNVHFDRIAHLVKLVFNTKLVLVSLVGENEQIFQTESGGGGSVTLQVLQRLAASRDCSFCAHAILQDGDEPIVILDASRDWRFAGNPLVLGPPNIRFYAGSPLRTADGYNIGSLCIIDDQPWTEFSPRQRHTLKEFARVVMREMELLRDRIQLGLRDSMQRSIESFTRECVEMDLEDTAPAPPKVDEALKGEGSGSSAARAIKDALQLSGAVVFDLSHLELLDTVAADVDDVEARHSVFFPGPLHEADYAGSFNSPPGSVRSRHTSVLSDTAGIPETELGRRSSDDSIRYGARQQQTRLVPPMAVLGSCETLAPPQTREDPVPLSHHLKVAEFLRVHRSGRYFPFIPGPFRHLLPAGMSNLLMVPIFGLNKQPFAMLCAYSQDHEDTPSLDELKESGLQYLRAIGMIVLSAVLKKDIVLADKAKSHFISNISHELRTPLHGILAAAELLAETKLNSTQGSYLETVEACGKSLLELVNHVLDFTKLSGNSLSNAARHQEKTKCDLVKLTQEVCESSWIGSIAKALENKHSGIGSVYAPPSDYDEYDDGSTQKKISSGVVKMRETGVEVVIDISIRESGWLVQCDAGGIRRVLMNLIGNSLKFTTSGFVHVSLREIQSTDTHVVIELGVTDTGRGISRSFLEEQLFHPFTQENPLGTGTGLGLSIVNSIVQSPALNGKIDVWSTEGQGTEIRVTCELELSEPSVNEGMVYRPALRVQRLYSVSLLSFGYTRGEEDLKEVIKSYLADWWGFEVSEAINPNVVPEQLGDLVLINEDTVPLRDIIQRGGRLPPVILLASARGDTSTTAACEAYHAAGGVARVLFKPAGPAKLESVLDFCLQCLELMRRGDPPDPRETKPSTPLPSPSPSPRESPAWRPVLEQQKSYFGPTADPISGTDIAKKDTDADMTPTDDVTPGSRWNDLTPKPKGIPSPSNLHKHSPHISPHPPEANSTLLIRRHSAESKVSHVATLESDGADNSCSQGNKVAHAQASAGSAKPSRPLLPPRSITYHEPRLHKHVLMSPHGGAWRSGAGHSHEGPDYFAFTSSSGAGSTPTERDTGSLPSSPGSVISLEGGEGAVLKTAVQTPSASMSSSTSMRATQGSSSAVKPKRQLKILSVEDNPINRRVIQAFLTKMGVEFVEATDGVQGVKAFAAHPPHYFDVILMDLSMPNLDGIGATAAIRRIELDREKDGSATPTGAMSTSSTVMYEARGPPASSTGRRVSPGSQVTTSPTSTADSHQSTGAAPVPSSETSMDSSTAAAASATATAAIAATSSGPPRRLPHPRTRVKIFALTGRSTDEDKRKAFATGADGYIVKPLSYKVLSSLLKMLAR